MDDMTLRKPKKFQTPLSSFGYFRREFFKRNGCTTRKRDTKEALATWNSLKPKEKLKYEMIRRNARNRYKNSIRNTKRSNSTALHESDDKNYSISALCYEMNKTNIHADCKMEFEEFDADDEQELDENEVDFGYFSD